MFVGLIIGLLIGVFIGTIFGYKATKAEVQERRKPYQQMIFGSLGALAGCFIGFKIADEEEV